MKNNGMKRMLMLIVLSFAILACKINSDDAITVSVPPPPVNNPDTVIIPADGYEAQKMYPGYALAWSNEFDSTALSADEWTFESGDGCPQLCGWGNNELEYYTNRSDNLFFKEGKMIIRARKESNGEKSYTSARIKTQGKKTFKFGRIDIRAVLPAGKGIWPAFWLMPENNIYGNWPSGGEIDMMEFLGHEPSRVHGTIHYGPSPGSKSISNSMVLSNNDSFDKKFHVFSLIWEADKIQWLVDDVVFSTISKSDLGSDIYTFNEDFYFIINLAVGGNWPGSPDATTKFPRHLIVDYLRVYQIP
jgi:beta-glucanase (GH16 family)